MKKKSDSKALKITLTSDEYDVLCKFASLSDKSLARAFMDFSREVGFFVMLKNMSDLIEKLKNEREDLKQKFEGDDEGFILFAVQNLLNGMTNIGFDD